MNNQVLGKIIRLKRPYLQLPTDGTAMWTKFYNGVLFLDLKKAFDCVNNQILLNKLAMYGVCGRTLNWFESYLSKRKQTCKLNNIFSEMRQTKTGGPQGSNLGPLLFLASVNDLPSCYVC